MNRAGRTGLADVFQAWQAHGHQKSSPNPSSRPVLRVEMDGGQPLESLAMDKDED
jgi:hypothetical protein